jgi:hypothetical protein
VATTFQTLATISARTSSATALLVVGVGKI